MTGTPMDALQVGARMQVSPTTAEVRA
jgi:hypothetical protein